MIHRFAGVHNPGRDPLSGRYHYPGIYWITQPLVKPVEHRYLYAVDHSYLYAVDAFWTLFMLRNELDVESSWSATNQTYNTLSTKLFELAKFRWTSGTCLK